MSAEHPASREDVEVLMVHLSLLAEWRMRTLGNALGSGVVAGLLLSMVLALALVVGVEWTVMGPLGGVLVAAVMLVRAEAPVPETS